MLLDILHLELFHVNIFVLILIESYLATVDLLGMKIIIHILASKQICIGKMTTSIHPHWAFCHTMLYWGIQLVLFTTALLPCITGRGKNRIQHDMIQNFKLFQL